MSLLPQRPKHWCEQAVWQDVEFGAYAADLALWEELARETAGATVELGAGSGRVSMHLAGAGIEMVAIERDPELVAELAGRAEAEGLPVTALEGDIADGNWSDALPEGAGTLVWVAVALLLGGLGSWGAAIAAMRRSSLRRSPWATRWYVSAAAFFGFGMIAGSLLAHGEPWPYGDLLGAHMALNLAGWLGAAILGTLHTFYPSLTQTQLRFPRAQAAAFLAWAGGVAALILNTAGTRNTAYGAGTMVFNSVGDDNTGVGYFSLYTNDTGNRNSGDTTGSSCPAGSGLPV